VPPPSESSVDEAWQADERRGVVDEIVGIDLEGLVEFTQLFFGPSSIRARELRGEVLFDAVFLDRLQQASDGDQMSLPESRKLAQ
jgi:hypothetical protein